MKKKPCGYRNVYKRIDDNAQILGVCQGSRDSCDVFNSDPRAWGVKPAAGMHRRIGVLHIYSKEK